MESEILPTFQRPILAHIKVLCLMKEGVPFSNAKKKSAIHPLEVWTSGDGGLSTRGQYLSQNLKGMRK